MVRLHRIILFIISDSCTQFTSLFWKYFRKGLGTRVKLTINLYPQTYGQVEFTNKTLEGTLRGPIIEFKLIGMIITF